MTRFAGKLIGLLLLTCLVLCAVSAVGSETYFKFKVPSRTRLDKITRVVSIDNVRDGEVYAYANDRELADFERLDIAYEVLPHPGTLIVPRMAATKSALADWDAYPTYDAYVAMMYQYQTDHPDLCRIVDVGPSVLGRSLLFARISDNVDVEEDEPEVMHTSSMHGDETTGYILCLRLIDSLLVGYGSDPYITRLVDDLEIWINPLANPDGAYYSGNHTIYGARRYNANGADLNRNFPDPLDGDHPDGKPWQPETVAMMDLAEAQSFAISANHHGGAEVINYPWDTWPRLHADDSWFIDICYAWASSAQGSSPSGYMESSRFPDGITNGFDWYRVAGGRQDYMNYWQGCREITTELSNTKLLPADQLPDHWNYNRIGLLQYLENALYGVRGIVTDATTALPLAATVRVLNHDMDNSEVYTDPDIGDYHRMLSAGEYNLEFTAPGYRPDTTLAVLVSEGLSTLVDVSLEFLSGDPDLALAGHTANLVGSGDNVSIAITLINSGDGNALDISGELFSNDPYLTISQNSSAFPLIPGLGGTAESTSDYLFSVSSGCPLNHHGEFRLELTGAGDYTSTIYFGVVISPLVEDFETAGLLTFPWQHGGDQNWSVVFLMGDEGYFSARSGSIQHSQSSTLSLTLEVARSGRLWFDYRVSSEISGDFLRFFIDDIEQSAWSGDLDWSRVGFDVAAGVHTFCWVYEKDADVSSGQDKAWLDRVVFPALVGSLDISTETLPDWTVGQPYAQRLESSGSLGVVSWTDKNGGLAGTGLELSTSGDLTGTSSAQGAIQFVAEVCDGAGLPVERPLGLQINPIPVITTSSLPEADRGSPYEFQLQAASGTPPLAWSDRDGQLAETGLELTAEGLLAGVPVVRGTVDFTARVEDAAGATDETLLSLYVDGGCCDAIVGDANNSGGAEPTIGDITAIIDLLFVTEQPLACYAEADINQSGGMEPTADDITIGDITLLIDHLFVSGIELAECL